MNPKAPLSVLTAEAKATLVPELRFLAFRGEGDSTRAKLGSVATIGTEKVGGQQLCAHEHHKNGRMQQLFPSPEEVTA